MSEGLMVTDFKLDIVSLGRDGGFSIGGYYTSMASFSPVLTPPVFIAKLQRELETLAPGLVWTVTYDNFLGVYTTRSTININGHTWTSLHQLPRDSAERIPLTHLAQEIVNEVQHKLSQALTHLNKGPACPVRPDYGPVTFIPNDVIQTPKTESEPEPEKPYWDF